MTIKRLLSVIFLLVAAAVSCAGCASAADADDIESLVSQFRKETRCSSVSVVVLDRGGISYFGDRDALYQIGSMTKAFTGLAARRLINEGVVSENAFIDEYIPGFEAYYDSQKVSISVKDLLEQKSGYTNNEKDFPSAADGMTLSEWAEDISGRDLKCRPGTEYNYSNVNYDLLGLIIENASGMSYRKYMEEEILAPLGLGNTFVGTPSDKRIAEGTRLGYRQTFPFPIKVKEASIPAGYFYSNAQDMGRWAEIWTGRAALPEDMEKAVNSVLSMLRNEGDYYSGWEVFPGGIIGHSGGTPNYSSRIAFSDDGQTGVCVLCNLNVAATTDSLCSSIFDILSGSSPKGLSKDIWTVFDIIFCAVTGAGVLIFVLLLRIKKKALLITLGAVLITLLALVLILFPVIFGAGIGAILFIWAPWSLAGGLLVTAGDIAGITIKLLSGNHNADNNKTGKGQAADGHDRISGI